MFPVFGFFAWRLSRANLWRKWHGSGNSTLHMVSWFWLCLQWRFLYCSYRVHVSHFYLKKRAIFCWIKFRRWYPGQVVSNAEYPEKNDPRLNVVGFVAIKWLPYRGKITYNLVPVNRLISMKNDEFLYNREASKSKIFAEWKLAKEYADKNCSEYSTPKADQISADYSNGERVKRITVKS